MGSGLFDDGGWIGVNYGGGGNFSWIGFKISFEFVYGVLV